MITKGCQLLNALVEGKSCDHMTIKRYQLNVIMERVLKRRVDRCIDMGYYIVVYGMYKVGCVNKVC